jgi:hypothetical protein
MSVQEKLEQYIEAPTVPEHSFEIGYEYELIGQYASAMGYYLKCAENTDSDLLAYECLVRKALCFRKLGGREAHVQINCQHAISLMPGRPEAYHLLSQSYEYGSHWMMSHMIARTGQRLNAERDPLMYDLDGMDLDYPGPFALPFQEAVALWWIGRFDECLVAFKDLQKNYKLNKAYAGHVKWNIDNLEGRDADALAGIKKIKKGITNKDEVIKKILAEKKK